MNALFTIVLRVKRSLRRAAFLLVELVGQDMKNMVLTDFSDLLLVKNLIRYF